MFFITFPTLWSFSYFFFFIYVTVIFSIILYAIPAVREFLNYNKFKKTSSFDYLTGFDMYWLLLTPLFLFTVVNFTWVSPSVSAWFGSLIFAQFQCKMGYLVIFVFYLVLTVYCTSMYFSSKEIYDYTIVCFNFFFWTYFLFTANTLFTVVFFIEVISTLILLLLISSSFSTTYFFNNLNLNLHNYFNSTTPFFFVQMLMYFFWISLITSLNLFLFLILFYIQFLTFDFFLFEFVFYTFVNASEVKDVFFVALVWLNLLFCVFLKCGLVPFYFWKPVFFRGMPIHALFFYIVFFYFFILLFFIYFFIVCVNEVFYFFIIVNTCLLILGFVILLFILCEAYYVKAFLALSSILNTLFVFLAMNGTDTTDFLFFL